MNLKESRERYVGGFWGKEERDNVVAGIQSQK